jgi:hypothetical protein
MQLAIIIFLYLILYVCVVRFDVTVNLKFFTNFFKN